MQTVRILLILFNTVGFGVMAGVLVRSTRRQTEGLRLLHVAGAAAYGAVAIGGIQRLLLQGVVVGRLSEDVRFLILTDQAFIQALVVATLGLIGWRALRRAHNRVRAADSLLSAFGSELPDIDWKMVNLTRREEEVMALVSKGMLRDSELADRLGVSPETVRSHVKSIQRKTGLRSRVEIAVAVHYAAPSGGRQVF